MVLAGSSQAGLRHHERKLRRLSQKRSSMNALVIDEARREAESMGWKVFDMVNDGTLHGGSGGIRVPSRSFDSASSSLMSAQVAVQRGSMRALEEIVGPDDESEAHSTLSDFDASPDSKKKRKAKKKKKMLSRLRPKIFRTKKSIKPVTIQEDKPLVSTSKNNAITREAWMCGCCGKVFSSFELAEKHENQCINNVVDRLGYTDDEGSVSVSGMSNIDIDVDDDDNQHQYIPLTPVGDGVRSRSVVSTASLTGPMESTAPPNSPRLSTLPPPQKSRLAGLNKASVRFRRPSYQSDILEGGTLNESLRQKPLISRLSPSKSLRPFRRNTTDGDILVTHRMRQKIIVTDEALVNTMQRAQDQMLSLREISAESYLDLLSKTKSYYDMLASRSCELKRDRFQKFRTEGQDLASRIKNKFVDAYQLIKEGDVENEEFNDQYNKKGRKGEPSANTLVHDNGTSYVNVVVKHSLGVVNTELERLARQRWEDQQGDKKPTSRFEQFRAFAHGNFVKLASIALASDFTPRRVAVQLSNDLYRLIGPQLKRRGVQIETEIEYRVGPYFVLAVNVKKINWVKLMKYSHKVVRRSRQKWRDDKARRVKLREDIADEDEREQANIGPEDTGPVRGFVLKIRRLLNLTSAEIIAQALAWLYCVHWTISIPLCFIMYNLCRIKMDKFILATVTDEIFHYVEEKGMEMDIRIEGSRKQAAFMLSALREIREDNRQLKKQQATEGGDEGDLLGPLLGPIIKSDKEAAPPLPDGFEVPENLEFVGLEVDLPVGFKRLRWAMLHGESEFVQEAIFRVAANYTEITVGEWTKHGDVIGSAEMSDISEDDIVGAELETNYLMPKSTFVKANMAYETSQITAYNDYCFCIKKRTLTPEVPYGSTFIAWTQLVFLNTGNNSCKLVCSTEAEFPNGPPLVSRQIQSGMRTGTAELFVLIGDTICKYADQFP